MGKNVNYKAMIIGSTMALKNIGIDDDISGQEIEVIYEFDDNYCICKTKNGREYDISKNLLNPF